jgi:hypothetical protein
MSHELLTRRSFDSFASFFPALFDHQKDTFSKPIHFFIRNAPYIALGSFALAAVIGLPSDVFAAVDPMDPNGYGNKTSGTTGTGACGGADWATPVLKQYAFDPIQGGLKGIQWAAYSCAGLATAVGFTQFTVSKQPPTKMIVGAGVGGIGAGASGSAASALMKSSMKCDPTGGVLGSLQEHLQPVTHMIDAVTVFMAGPAHSILNLIA